MIKPADNINEEPTIPNDENFVKRQLGNSDNYHKVLGVGWDVKADQFVYEFRNLVLHFGILAKTKGNRQCSSILWVQSKPLHEKYRMECFNIGRYSEKMGELYME